LPSNGTAASTLTIFAGGFATSGNVTVTATSGSLTHSVTVKFAVVSRNPDFTITANPGNQILQPGSSANSTLILTSINGFNGTISLTTPLVPCFTYCWFINPGTVNLTPGGTASSTLTFTTTPQIQPGNYSITVSAIANGGSPSHSVTVFFSVLPASTSQDFTISASPTNITITAGSTGTSTVNVTSINNFAGTVFLTATVSSSGPTTNLNPANMTLRGGGTASSILTVSTTASTPAGFYIVTVTGNSPSIGKSHSFQVGVTVTNPTPPDFTITASPTSRSVSRSSTTSFTITITGKNGFNGTITLTTSISPIVRNGPTITLPSTVGPYSNSTLTVSAVHKTPLGSYTITITAISGSLTHSVTVTVTVTR